MMGTWATLKRPSPKHALFTPVVRVINTIGTRISLAKLSAPSRRLAAATPWLGFCPHQIM
jgi:hypothetical protein